MKQFERLYSLDKKGKIRQFNVRVEEVEDGYGMFTETGMLDGKSTSKLKVISKGKYLGKANETTPYEQAISEARSKHNDKLDEGYKSDLMCVDRFKRSYLLCVKERYILTNTNANWDELPMLATAIKKIKVITFPAYIQPKLNGVRCLAKWKNGEVVLMSRGGKYYDVPHIKEELKSVFAQDYTLILDGEIFNKDYSLQHIVGAVKGSKRDKSFLEYHIYDLAIRELQNKRFDILWETILFPTKHNTSIRRVTTKQVQDRVRIKEAHDSFVADGYEGAVVRLMSSYYAFGFRSTSLIKVKEFIDEEFIIIGCKITEGKSIGDSFVFALQNNVNNQTFYARPKGTRVQKEEWYANQLEWTGERATVRYQERTEEGLPHQAHVVVIRDYE